MGVQSLPVSLKGQLFFTKGEIRDEANVNFQGGSLLLPKEKEPLHRLYGAESTVHLGASGP